MTVSNSWLVNVTVNINTTVQQPPSFNQAALVGIMPTQNSPYQSPPTSWAGASYKAYTDLATFNADFSLVVAGAVAAGDYMQANRFNWLINAANAFFSVAPTPDVLYVFASAVPASGNVYSTLFSSMTAVQNAFYGFSICDNILANAYSYVVATIVTSSANVTIPAGTFLTPATASPAYFLPQDFVCTTAGTYHLVFYSTDTVTVVAPSTFTGLSPAPSGITSTTNAAAAVLNLSGYLTPIKGIDAGLAALRAGNNQKKFFADFSDNTQAGLMQADVAHASEDVTCFFCSLNLPQHGAPVATQDSIAAASMGEYFTNVFVGNNGLTVLSSMQLTDANGVAIQTPDPTVTDLNIGSPTQAGSSTNLIGWNNNVYAAFGAGRIGAIQYGNQSNSTLLHPIYLDLVVGADYLQLTAQQDLVNFIFNSQPSGIPYSDQGIQQLLNVFKNSMQNGVNQGILQQFTNANFSYLTLAQCAPADIAARIYRGLVFTGKFLSRIQQIKVTLNLSL